MTFCPSCKLTSLSVPALVYLWRSHWFCPLFLSVNLPPVLPFLQSPRCSLRPPCPLLSVSLHLSSSEVSIHQKEEEQLKSRASHRSPLSRSLFAYKHISACLDVSGTRKNITYSHVLCPIMIQDLHLINMRNEIYIPRRPEGALLKILLQMTK